MSTQTEFKSNQGQQAEPLRLQFDDMSDNEKEVVALLAQEGRPVMSIKEIMEALNWHRGQAGRARGNSRVRNTVRRLIRSNWLTHKSEVGDGLYRITTSGLNRFMKLVEEGEKNLAAPKAPKKHKAKKATPDDAKEVLKKLADAGLTIADVQKVTDAANDEQEF
jgi:hypothetical protein